jgi:hypothetical protein
MSSGLVNPVATETNSTCTAAGGGGVIWLDVPPLQPSKNTAPAAHAIAEQIASENRADINPPGWSLYFALPR